ncbi:MAG: phenylalanine--tRNA ligase subunit alpha, partial [Micrococcales bacterium]
MSENFSISPETVAAAVADAVSAISAASDLASLRASKVSTVGEQSPVAKLNAQLKNLPHEQKAAAGALIGQARAQLQEAFSAREAELETLEEAKQLAAEAVDVTAAPAPARLGARHPLSLLQDQISDIFIG